jgi:hypothetical protein
MFKTTLSTIYQSGDLKLVHQLYLSGDTSDYYTRTTAFLQEKKKVVWDKNEHPEDRSSGIQEYKSSCPMFSPKSTRLTP